MIWYDNDDYLMLILIIIYFIQWVDNILINIILLTNIGIIKIS